MINVMFAQFGLPKVMVTDNGARFTTSEFAELAKFVMCKLVYVLIVD